MPMKDAELIARELLGLWGQPVQIEPLSKTEPDMSLSRAYEIAGHIRLLRIDRGELVLGRKIGFTNQSIWKGFGISAPIWA